MYFSYVSYLELFFFFNPLNLRTFNLLLVLELSYVIYFTKSLSLFHCICHLFIYLVLEFLSLYIT